MKKIRVIVVNRNIIVRVGIRTIIEDVPALEIVAELADLRKAWDCIQIVQPDMVLLELGMTQGAEFDLITQIIQHPQTHLLILAAEDQFAGVTEILTKGALLKGTLPKGAIGYVFKSASLAVLKEAMLTVGQGQPYADPNFALSAEQLGVYPSALTPRKIRVLQLIAKGNTLNDSIKLLGNIYKTAYNHLTQVMKRLGVHNVVGLVQHAIMQELVTANSTTNGDKFTT
ncbi:MAG: response regulator transcription factor [Chloroflexota bacterium]